MGRGVGVAVRAGDGVGDRVGGLAVGDTSVAVAPGVPPGGEGTGVAASPVGERGGGGDVSPGTGVAELSSDGGTGLSSVVFVPLSPVAVASAAPGVPERGVRVALPGRTVLVPLGVARGVPRAVDPSFPSSPPPQKAMTRAATRIPAKSAATELTRGHLRFTRRPPGRVPASGARPRHGQRGRAQLDYTPCGWLLPRRLSRLWPQEDAGPENPRARQESAPAHSAWAALGRSPGGWLTLCRRCWSRLSAAARAETVVLSGRHQVSPRPSREPTPQRPSSKKGLGREAILEQATEIESS